ncbi:MAG: hypothetical protein SGI74_13770 [Oligoflexia bacterium]|nr:hypothetical protein [Oligoflexia bacterium]
MKYIVVVLFVVAGLTFNAKASTENPAMDELAEVQMETEFEQTQVDQLKQDDQFNSREAGRLQNEIKQAKAKLQMLKNRNEATARSIQKKNERVQRESQALSQESQQLTKLQAQTEVKERNIESLNAKIEDLTQKRQDIRIKMSEVKVRFAKASTAQSRLQKKQEALNKQLRDLRLQKNKMASGGNRRS